jgi:23S rRNA pseudouridine2605 synthase
MSPAERSSTRTGDGGRPVGERLQKILAQAGLGSRRSCEELIAAGRVRVNGRVAQLGTRANAEVDRIEVDGAPVGVRAGLVHYLLNKPLGVVTTASDPQGRPAVVDLVPAEPRVFPVGRLDADTEGLLLLTNDGELAHRLTHPSFGVDKEYLAEVEGKPSRGAIRRLRDGVDLEDGRTAPAKVSAAGDHLLRITIHEGRNRQVRRMCAAVGNPVRRLVRVRVGPVSDRRLAPGEWRVLTQAEVRSLERATAESRPRPAGRSRGRGPARPTGRPASGRSSPRR